MTNVYIRSASPKAALFVNYSEYLSVIINGASEPAKRAQGYKGRNKTGKWQGTSGKKTAESTPSVLTLVRVRVVVFPQRQREAVGDLQRRLRRQSKQRALGRLAWVFPRVLDNLHHDLQRRKKESTRGERHEGGRETVC